MFAFFEWTAMALDTLPAIGRGLLLGFLLSITLAGVNRGIRRHPSLVMQLYYKKAALLGLILVPALVSLLGLKMPVYVEQAQYFPTNLPTLVTVALASVWLLGVCWHVGKLMVELARIERKLAAIQDATPVGENIERRIRHWQHRLNVHPGPKFLVSGSAPAWQALNTVVLPDAVRHWPVGQVDVGLLLQLALVKQRGWSWLLCARLVAALYWPAPWVARMYAEFAHALGEQALGLARAAYRDDPGWRRDLSKYNERTQGLPAMEVRMVLGVTAPLDDTRSRPTTPVFEAKVGMREEITPAARWRATKQRRAEREFDPYERVYWLIALASVVVSIGTTLTIRQASPEFEPGFLNIRWQDQMGRRHTDTDEVIERRRKVAPASEPEPPPP